MEKKCWEKNVRNIFLEKTFKKKILEKKFWKKDFGKMNYKTKIFITKIYKNINKYHTIFALLASFDKNRARERESNENVCGICTRHWFKIGSVARLHCTQGMWRFERSRDKRYITALRAVGNPLSTWAVSASSVVRNFSPGLAPTMKRRALSTTKKSSVVHQLFSSRTMLNFCR